MAAKPTSVPRWAETATGTPAANITIPLSGEQDSGWVNGQVVVSSAKMNWLFRTIYDWVLYLADAVFVAAAGSALAGVSGTGDGSAPGVSGTGGATNGAGVRGNGTGTGAGVSATGGSSGPGVLAAAGGATPARGALNAAPQAAPTAPADGDVWVLPTGELQWRGNGATKTSANLVTTAQQALQFWLTPGSWTSGAQTFAWGSINPSYSGTSAANPNSESVAAGSTILSAASGKLGTLRIRSDSTGQTVAVTVTVRKNGADVATGTWSASTNTFSLDCSAVSVAAGDWFSLKLVPQASGVGVPFHAALPVTL